MRFCVRLALGRARKMLHLVWRSASVNTTVIVLLLSPALAMAGDIEKIDLFRVGDHGYNLYHIPGVTVTANGVVLAWCEARKNAGHDWDDIDILLRSMSAHRLSNGAAVCQYRPNRGLRSCGLHTRRE